MRIAPMTAKLFRDLWHIRGQATAIALVVASGVAILVMSRGMVVSLSETRDAYYERQHFADVFAHATRAPNRLLTEIAAIPGVARAEGRIVSQATLDINGMDEPAHGRLISLPPPGAAGGLDTVVLEAGTYPRPGHADEVLASEAFAQAHRFEPGAHLSAVINGRKRYLTITGIALSPEFVYSLGPGQLMPDNARFGILWMDGDALAAAFDMQGAFNDVIMTLLPNADEDSVIDAVDEKLARYGGTGAYGRKDQLSNAFLDNELNELKTIGAIAPPIFLGVAMFLLHVSATRLIETEREQIGLLKAFGYSNLTVGWHYMKMVLGIAILGVALGWASGTWLGEGVTRLYTTFFRFPIFTYTMDPPVYATSGLLAIGLAAIGCLSAVRRAAKLPPAVAMAPAPPPVYRASTLERLAFMRRIAPPTRMILRHITRWPIRSALTITGIAMSVTILIGTLFFNDSLDAMVEGHFYNAQRNSIAVTFTNPRGPEALDDIRALDGVLVAEPTRTVAVRLKFRGRVERTHLTGLAPHPRLHRLIDTRERPMEPPPWGIVLTDKLAEMLGAVPGDKIEVEVLEGKRPIASVPVAALGGERIGKPAYMSLAALDRLMGDGPLITGAAIQSDSDHEAALYKELKNMPEVVGVTLQNASVQAFRDTMAETIDIVLSFYLAFGAVIAGGTVYNAARISLSERGRELASLRVLGFTRLEVSFILLGEIAVLTLAALPIGCVLGYGMASFLVASFQIELFRLPLVVAPSTYGTAVATVVAAAVAAGLLVRQRIDTLDLIEVLKTRE